jgi:co-chaperonin GroES (HSP10)
VIQTIPKPLGQRILIDPVYDPEKIGSLYIPPAATNPLPSNGHVVAVGSDQDEVEVGYRVLVSTYGVDATRFITVDDHEYVLYFDHEVVAFLTPDAEVFPRRDAVIIRPNWLDKGEQKYGSLHLLTRSFASPPPKLGTVLRTGERVHSLHRGDVVVLPKTGGNELGVRDRVVYSIKESDILGKVQHD